MVSVADLCCRCVSVRLLPGDGFVRHQADPDVEGKFTHTHGATVTRKVLVVLQYTASLVLLCGTLIVYAQLQYMRNASLGVRVDQTLVLKFPAQCEELAMKLEAFKKEVALLPPSGR